MKNVKESLKSLVGFSIGVVLITWFIIILAFFAVGPPYLLLQSIGIVR